MIQEGIIAIGIPDKEWRSISWKKRRENHFLRHRLDRRWLSSWYSRILLSLSDSDTSVYSGWTILLSFIKRKREREKEGHQEILEKMPTGETCKANFVPCLVPIIIFSFLWCIFHWKPGADFFLLIIPLLSLSPCFPRLFSWEEAWDGKR